MVRRITRALRSGIVLVVLLLLAGCSDLTLKDFITGFFDPVVGSWAGPYPSTTTTLEFRADRTYTRTQVSGANTVEAIGTYAKDNATNTIVLTMTALYMNGAGQSPTGPETYSIVINSERTIMQLNDGSTDYGFARL